MRKWCQDAAQGQVSERYIQLVFIAKQIVSFLTAAIVRALPLKPFEYMPFFS